MSKYRALRLYDRETMALPEAHNRLIEAVAAANPNTAVVLQCGSPVELPWREKVNAILLTYLSGCQGGKAVLRLLRGEVSPSGKLAETWPVRYQDVPNAETFAVPDEHIQYRESIYVGYRWYDAAKKDVAYPFGHGLSYTSFAYSDLTVENDMVRLTVTNIGQRDGAEIVQVYTGLPDSAVYRPPLELRGFRKISLRPGESKGVSIPLPRSFLAIYDAVSGKWLVENGEYIVAVGASSRDIRLQAKLSVSDGAVPAPVSYPAKAFTQRDFEALLGHPVSSPSPARPVTVNTLLGQIDTFIARMVLKLSIKVAAKQMGGDAQSHKAAENMMGDMPIRSMGMGGGTRNTVYGLADIFDGHLLRGLKKIILGK